MTDTDEFNLDDYEFSESSGEGGEEDFDFEVDFSESDIAQGEDTFSHLNFDWIPDDSGKLVRMQTLGGGHCFFHSLLKCILPAYQNNPDNKIRTDMAILFREEIAKYLLSKSEKSEKEIISSVKDLYLKELVTNVLKIKERQIRRLVSKGKKGKEVKKLKDEVHNIERDGILLKDIDRDLIKKTWGFGIHWRDEKDSIPSLYRSYGYNLLIKDLSFHIVEKRDRIKVKPNSRFFEIAGGLFLLRSIMERNEEEAAMKEAKKGGYRYHSLFPYDQSAQLDNLLKVLRSDTYAQHNVISLTLNILGLNAVFIKNDFGVVDIENLEIIDEEYPFVLLFHVGDIHYESGGIKRSNGLTQTLFYPDISEDKKILNSIKRYLHDKRVGTITAGSSHSEKKDKTLSTEESESSTSSRSSSEGADAFFTRENEFFTVEDFEIFRPRINEKRKEKGVHRKLVDLL